MNQTDRYHSLQFTDPLTHLGFPVSPRSAVASHRRVQCAAGSPSVGQRWRQGWSLSCWQVALQQQQCWRQLEVGVAQQGLQETSPPPGCADSGPSTHSSPDWNNKRPNSTECFAHFRTMTLRVRDDNTHLQQQPLLINLLYSN